MRLPLLRSDASETLAPDFLAVDFRASFLVAPGRAFFLARLLVDFVAEPRFKAERPGAFLDRFFALVFRADLFRIVFFAMMRI